MGMKPRTSARDLSKRLARHFQALPDSERAAQLKALRAYCKEMSRRRREVQRRGRVLKAAIAEAEQAAQGQAPLDQTLTEMLAGTLPHWLNYDELTKPLDRYVDDFVPTELEMLDTVSQSLGLGKRGEIAKAANVSEVTVKQSRRRRKGKWKDRYDKLYP
jgi:hypothetical protein